MIKNDVLAGWAPRLLSVLRIVSALVLLQYGMTKVLGFPQTQMSGVSLAGLSLPGVAGIIELVGGALLLVGLFTRPTAFVLSGLMACAYFISHAARDFFPVNNGGNLAIILCFVFLYLFVAGPGPWSVDAARKSA